MKALKEFSNLPKNEQVYILFHDGTELLTRKHESYIIKLFQVEDIFVEIWYNAQKNVIQEIKVVDLDELIMKYDAELNLPDFLNN